MTEIPAAYIQTDSLQAVLPPDRFFKSCRDTALESIARSHSQNTEVKSFFTGHQLKTQKFMPGPSPRYQPDWILALLILCFVLLAWVMFLYRKRFHQLILAPFSRRHLNQLSREGNLFGERLAIALVVVFFIAISILVYQVNDLLFGGHIPFHPHNFSFFLTITLVMILFWVFKVGGILFAGKVFKTDTTTSMYLLNVLVTNIITGLILLPFLVLIIYLKSIIILYITLIILLLSLLFLFIRGFMIGLTLTKFSYIFLFVYLCTLEILPLIIMIKLSLIFYGSMISVN